MPTLSQPSTDSPILTTRQVGDLVGLRPRSVWDWAAKGKLPPPRRMGQRLVWLRADVLNWTSRLPPAREQEDGQ